MEANLQQFYKDFYLVFKEKYMMYLEKYADAFLEFE